MKRFNKKAAATVLVAATFALGGCAQQSLMGDTYSANEARQTQNVSYGVVESVRPVVISSSEGTNAVGTGAGAIVGGIAGSTIGGGKGSSIMAVLGAVAGGIAGNHVADSAGKRQGQELTIRMDSGRTISVVQGVENGNFYGQGDRVRILSNGGTTRVSY